MRPSAYDDFGAQPGIQRPADLNPASLDALYGAGSGFIRGGLGAYGERILGSGREYVQSNMSKYFSGHNVQYYFQVNDLYVKNKLKVVLFPFLHKGHWTRIAEQVVGGGLKYTPPHYDINAPDLYIPLMAFGTYIVLRGIWMGLTDRFSPEVLSEAFTKALLAWFVQWVLLKMSLVALGGAEAPILDLAAYGGYFFVGVSLSVLGRILWWPSYYLILIWTSGCMGVFLVKTMKRILFAEARSYDRDSSRHHYLLLSLAIAQFPLCLWLGLV